MNISLSLFAPEILASRGDGFGSPVPHRPVYLHTHIVFKEKSSERTYDRPSEFRWDQRLQIQNLFMAFIWVPLW